MAVGPLRFVVKGPEDLCARKLHDDHMPALDIAAHIANRLPAGRGLNLNLHFHMLFLDGVYVEHRGGALDFRWVTAPTSAELTELAQRIAQRIGRYRERQGPLQRDAQTSYLAGELIYEGPRRRMRPSACLRASSRRQIDPLVKFDFEQGGTERK